MHRDSYWRSKIPVPLVLLYLLNLVLVLALEVLLLYPCPTEMTPEELAQFDSTFEGCTIVQSYNRVKLNCYLVETADGGIYLIPTHSHGIFSSRARIYKKHITPIPADGEITIPIRIGVHTSNVTVSRSPLPYMENQEPSDLSISIDYYGGSTQAAATVYMVIAAVLEGLELALWYLITKQ